jgi:hypothetical protein
MEDHLIGLAWVRACLCLLQYRCNLEISGNSARRVGSVYFTVPRPANDIGLVVRT